MAASYGSKGKKAYGSNKPQSMDKKPKGSRKKPGKPAYGKGKASGLKRRSR